jgi:excisionase family DNA binding protein
MTERTAPTLPPEVFESVVNALATTLIQDYRERWNRRGPESNSVSAAPIVGPAPTWLKVADAANRARCSAATIRREVRSGRVRAVTVGGRRSLRFRAEWIDGWLEEASRQK